MRYTRAMISLQNDSGTFNYRVAAVILHPSGDGRVLTMREANEAAIHSFLPGGRCEVGEVSSQALIREVREELDTAATIERLLFIVENFFPHRDSRWTGIAHCLEFHFLVALPVDSHTYSHSSTWEITDGGVRLIFEWQHLDDTRFPLLPRFLQTELAKPLPVTPLHIIHDERLGVAP